MNQQAKEGSFKFGDRVVVNGRIGTYEGEHPIHGCSLVRFEGDCGQSMEDIDTLEPADQLAPSTQEANCAR